MKIIGYEPKEMKIKKEDIIVDVHYDRHQKLYAICLKDKNTNDVISDYEYARDKEEAQFTKQMMLGDIRNYLNDSYTLIESNDNNNLVSGGYYDDNIKWDTFSDDIECEELEENLINHLDTDILDIIKNNKEPEDYLNGGTIKCSKSAGYNLLKAYKDKDTKDIKLYVGALSPNKDDIPVNLITHMWVEIDENVYATNEGNNYRIAKDFLQIDKSKDLYSQVYTFLNKDGLREDLSQEVDSEGNQLTPEQVEFFKNSKVRDNRGRLLVVYHGTDVGNFKSFNKGSGQNGEYGSYGIYFTNNRNVAKTYLDGSRKEDSEIDKLVYDKTTKTTKTIRAKNSIYACYLNIVNPLIIDCEGRKALNCQIELGGQRYHHIDDICAYADDKGYDGVIAKNIIDSITYNKGDLGDDYVAFNPNQIKSIDNKNPSNSNNINEILNDNKLTEYRKDLKNQGYENSKLKDRLVKLANENNLILVNKDNFTVHHLDDTVDITLKKYANNNVDNVLFVDATTIDANAFHQILHYCKNNKKKGLFSLIRTIKSMLETPVYWVDKDENIHQLSFKQAFNKVTEQLNEEILHHRQRKNNLINRENNLNESLNEAMSDRIQKLIDKAYDICKKAGYDFSNPQSFKSNMLVKCPLQIRMGNEKVRRLGEASYPKDDITEIRLMPQLDEFKDDNSILSVILHEMGHIIAFDEDFYLGLVKYDGRRKGTMLTNSKYRSKLSHHGKRWQKIVADLSRESGLSLQRLANAEDSAEWKEINSDKYKYFFECPNCHQKLQYTKETAFVKTYDKFLNDGSPMWWCPICQKDTGKKIQFVKVDKEA